MQGLSEEVRQVQNAGLGAYLIWRLSCAYMAARRDANGCPLHILFLPVPILFHEDTASLVESTQIASGLRAFSSKFSISAQKKSDVLLRIHDRVDSMAPLSLQGMQLALGAKLVAINTQNAVVYPLSTVDASALPSSTKKLGKSAEKLGTWFAEVTLHEVSEILKVRF